MTDECACGSGETTSLCCALKPATPQERIGLRKQTQPSQWTCLPTAFAMVLDTPVSGIINFLGRDDDRGYHVQELVCVALSLGWHFTPFEKSPQLEQAACWSCKGRCGSNDLPWVECGRCEGSGVEKQPPMKLLSMGTLLESYSGVLVGRRKGSDKDHAVAWCHQSMECLDPERGVYGVSEFEIDVAWMGVKINGR